jgi:hypothetical protein
LVHEVPRGPVGTVREIEPRLRKLEKAALVPTRRRSVGKLNRVGGVSPIIIFFGHWTHLPCIERTTMKRTPIPAAEAQLRKKSRKWDGN